MFKYWLIFILYLFPPSIGVYSQCMNRDSLWKRLVYLRDSSRVPPNVQLIELKKYESQANNCSYRNDSLHVLLLQRIGSAYLKLGDYSQSENFIKAAVNIVEKNRGKPYINESFLVRCYYTLSSIYKAQSSLSRKAWAEDSCIAVALRTHTIDIFLLQALIEKVNTLCETGDFYRSIEYANKGEDISSTILHGMDSLKYSTQFFFWKVNALYFLNQFTQAEKILNKKIEEFSKVGTTDYDGYLYERMASIKTQEEDYPAAIKYYDQSLSSNKKKKAYLSCLQTYVNMGYYLYDDRLHNNEKALNCYSMALKFASLCLNNASPMDSVEINIQRLNIYESMANVYVSKAVFDSAEIYFHKAYSQVIGDYEKNKSITGYNIDFIDGKNAVYLLYTLIDEGDGFLKKYYIFKDTNSLDEAARIYSMANGLQSRINSQQVDFQSRLFWRNNLHRLYENAIETHYLLNQFKEAFYFFEKSRAFLLSEQLKKQQVLGKDDIFKLSRIKQKNLQLNRELNSLSINSGHYIETQNKIFANNQELLQLEQFFKSHNPFYYQSIIDTNTVQLSDLQIKLFENHEAMLEIFSGDSAVYTLLITGQNSYLNKTSKSEFEQITNLYNSLISNSARLNNEYSKFIQTSNHLYRLLFNKNRVPAGRLIISPDGHYFPFEALITDTNRTTYFLNDHSVSYTYSARYLLNDFFADSSVSTGSFLGLAPVKFPTALHLATLSQSDVSLEKISSNFRNSQIITGSGASRNNFMHQFQSYKIIQLYTHASDSSSYGEPVLYFADSALYLSELIPENKTATQLIVLSACETGNGKLYKGEGVFSFNRGFAALGIPSSIINLWSVENESTYKITELFYKYVAEGLPLDVALQKAKLDFIDTSPKKRRLPYYWAAMVVVGKTDAVEVNAGFQWKWIALMGVTILITLVYFGIKRKNKLTAFT